MEDLGWSCDQLYDHSRTDLLAIIESYDGIVLRSRIQMDEAFLSKAENLKFIGRPGAGLENIDTTYCEQHNIKVFRSPEGNRDAVAEHCLAMLLSLFTNLKRADQEVRKNEWKREPNRGIELMGKMVGIYGYGFMGKAFAKRLRGFDVNVIAYDKYVNGFGDEHVREVTENTFFKEADIVSLHTPLTEETIGMVNDAFLKRFTKPIYFINTARGKSVVTQDLVSAIVSESVLGACIDVLEYESTSFTGLDEIPEALQYLQASDRVLLTPHIACWTHEAKLKMGEFLVEKIIKAFPKEYLAHRPRPVRNSSTER